MPEHFIPTTLELHGVLEHLYGASFGVRKGCTRVDLVSHRYWVFNAHSAACFIHSFAISDTRLYIRRNDLHCFYRYQK